MEITKDQCPGCGGSGKGEIGAEEEKRLPCDVCHGEGEV